MRVLHVVKTSEGAAWAAFQASELMRQGVDVHVALPDLKGKVAKLWLDAGVQVHILASDFPLRRPWELLDRCSRIKRLVSRLQPDLIHAHHFASAMLFRLALGKNHHVPRVFQVPGPLHVEHALFRNWDLGTAGDLDYWIATNRYTAALYSRAGVLSARVLLSYYGFPVEQFSGCHGGTLRRKLDIGDGSVLVGNISYIYAPKYYLGQTVGLKCHEDLIDALDIVTRERPGVIGVLAGSAWGRAATYEQSLRERAASLGQGRILMPGYLTPDEVKEAWPDFACVVHASLSDACAAGVLEPLLAGVPTIASRVGGLPEVVVDGVTGILVQPRKPRELAQAVLTVLDDLATYRAMALTGRELVRTMFDVRRTASEVLAIYRHILDPSQPRPDEFDSQRFLEARHAVG